MATPLGFAPNPTTMRRSRAFQRFTTPKPSFWVGAILMFATVFLTTFLVIALRS